MWKILECDWLIVTALIFGWSNGFKKTFFLKKQKIFENSGWSVEKSLFRLFVCIFVSLFKRRSFDTIPLLFAIDTWEE